MKQREESALFGRSRAALARLFLPGALLAMGAAAATSSTPDETLVPQVWTGAEGDPVRFASVEELKEFLQTAAIVESDVIAAGITHPRKLLLEKDGIRLHAHFQSYDETEEAKRLKTGRLEIRFRDSYKFNIAAYELSRLLGMGNVPPSFDRRVKGEWGAITVWLENTLTEESRRQEGLKPTDALHWRRQLDRMWLFDDLIANIDRNQGNILIDAAWKIWLIDHTRAFRLDRKLEHATKIRGCDRSLWRRLRSTSDDEIRRAVESWLGRKEVNAVLARRSLLVEHIEELIRSRGEEAVLHDLNK